MVGIGKDRDHSKDVRNEVDRMKMHENEIKIYQTIIQREYIMTRRKTKCEIYSAFI